jgi:hypothetical protein
MMLFPQSVLSMNSATGVASDLMSAGGTGWQVQSGTSNGLIESTSVINGRATAMRVDANFVQVTSDFTQDGVLDTLQVNRRNGASLLFLNQSAPTGSPTGNSIVLQTLPPNWEFSGLADGDGNGVMDLYWTNQVTGQGAVWLGTGTLSPAFVYQVGAIGQPNVTLPQTLF